MSISKQQSLLCDLAEICDLFDNDLFDFVAEVLVVEISQVGILSLCGLWSLLQICHGFTCFFYIFEHSGSTVSLLITFHG
jgi:energy-converting hydrogenase Eha subunit H